MDDTRPDRALSERDIVILRVLSKDPQRSARELRDILDEEHDIDVSHVTVSESIRTMREDGVFREAILPNEEYYSFAFLEFKFDPGNFSEGWRDAMQHIRQDEHTLFYFLSDGEYQWKSVMMFPDGETHSRWIHEFYKDHGDVVQSVRNSVIHNVLKFDTAPEIYEQLPDDGG
jgi:DNA-binding Lrp family transcriptional regulator